MRCCAVRNYKTRFILFAQAKRNLLRAEPQSQELLQGVRAPILMARSYYCAEVGIKVGVAGESNMGSGSIGKFEHTA